ncbi:hypothetical protein [Geodermatophilus marinus]|uniref:hypothetical protein n=1 Tax=Geodermatophilus sp. LHW52908 TaxID=2303986 RepID=UPI000E3D1CB7|nr:hypothetical protein D0Z06_13675 [Geodermatophilus sp. LHW52908]
MIERVVVLGASGDLTRRLLMPAVAALADAGELPPRLAVLGSATTDRSTEGPPAARHRRSGRAAGGPAARWWTAGPRPRAPARRRGAVEAACARPAVGAAPGAGPGDREAGIIAVCHAVRPPGPRWRWRSSPPCSPSRCSRCTRP